MKHLFSNTNLRRAAIIQILNDHDDFVDLSYIKEKTNFSESIIRKDIHFFNSYYDFLSVDVVHGKARLKFPPYYGIEMYYQSMFYEEDSCKILEYIYYHPNCTIDEIGNHLFLSNATVYRKMKDINDMLKDNYTDIHISSAPLTLEGNEHKVRLFMTRYFMEKSILKDWTIEGLDYEDVNELENMRSAYFRKNNSQINRLVVIIYFAIAIQRNKQGFYMNKKINYAPHISFLEMVKTNMDDRDIHLPLEQWADVFSEFFNGTYIKDYKTLIEKSKKDNFVKYSLKNLERFFEEAKKQFNIKPSNQEDLMVRLHNEMYMLRAGTYSRPIVYEYPVSVRRFYKEKYPSFYNFLKEFIETYFDALGFVMDEDNILAGVTKVLMAWTSLLSGLSKNSNVVSILIVSNISSNYRHIMREYIEENISKNVNIDLYNIEKIDDIKKVSSSYDILVTTFPTEPIDDRPIIFVPYMPSKRHLNLIVDAIKVLNGEILESELTGGFIQ